MAAVIVRWKNGVDRVFPLEHPGCVRHADVEAAVRRVLFRRIDHRRARMLLEHVPDHLNRVDVRLAFCEFNGFVEPSYGRTERGTPRANLSFTLQRAHCAPQLGIADVLHLRIV